MGIIIEIHDRPAEDRFKIELDCVYMKMLLVDGESTAIYSETALVIRTLITTKSKDGAIYAQLFYTED